MNHIAFNVPLERFEEYHAKLKSKGVTVTRILNHDNSPTQSSDVMTDDVYVRSMYFFDPDGICLEFAAWTRELPGPGDVAHAPRSAADAAAYRSTASK